MDSPLVSVLVPIFNVERYLDRCLDSVRAQTLRDIEVILIDDGSTDGSAGIVERHARADERVCAVHKANSGYGDSLNRGLEMARGEWVAIAEPDDWMEPTMLERLVDAARAYEGEGEGEGRKARAEGRPRPESRAEGQARTEVRPGQARTEVRPGRELPARREWRPGQELPARRRLRVDIVKAGYRRVVCTPGAPPFEQPCAHLSLRGPEHQPFSLDEFPELIAMHPSIWSAIYRRDFLEEFAIRFLPIPGAGWADNPFLVETMVAARAILWVPEALYHYRELADGSLSHLADWRIITDRWADMNEVLRRYDVQVPDILEAHAWRGCAYLQMLAHDFDQADCGLAASARAMAASIDCRLVGRSRKISRDYKQALARYLAPRECAVLLASWVADRARRG